MWMSTLELTSTWLLITEYNGTTESGALASTVVCRRGIFKRSVNDVLMRGVAWVLASSKLSRLPSMFTSDGIDVRGLLGLNRPPPWTDPLLACGWWSSARVSSVSWTVADASKTGWLASIFARLPIAAGLLDLFNRTEAVRWDPNAFLALLPVGTPFSIELIWRL